MVKISDIGLALLVLENELNRLLDEHDVLSDKICNLEQRQVVNMRRQDAIQDAIERLVRK